MNKVVITGATGAIGISLINIFIEKNIEVLVLANPGSHRNKYIPVARNVKVIEVNADDYDKVDVKGERYDVFYNFAWQDGRFRDAAELQYKNIERSLKAVRLAKRLGCHKFIGSGSQAEYGVANTILSDKVPAFPCNAFGAAKLCSGQLSRSLCNELGMEHIWTRILSVYGPYDGENTMIISAINKWINGDRPKFTYGEQEWDYIFSDDAANALYLLGMTDGINDKIYCIGSGRTKKIKEFIEDIYNKLNPEMPLIFGELPYLSNQINYLCADISELTKDTGFQPKVSFEEGIKKTINWCKNKE